MSLHDTKDFYRLPAGANFKARILNIQPGKVTIQLDSGGTFTARSRVLPDARIGEDSYFMVKSNNFEGLIELEMLKNPPQIRQDNMVKEALLNSGMYTGEENMILGRELVELNLPVNAQTVQKLSFFRNSVPDTSLEKALFLVQEGFSEEASSVQALNVALDPSQHLTQQLSELIGLVAGVPQEDLRRDMMEILDPSKVFMSELKPIRQFYTELQDALIKLADVSVECIEIRERLEKISESFKFMKKVNNRVKYYQIPFRNNKVELFLYDKSKAVIGVDTRNLGRIEFQAAKMGRQIMLSFGADSNKVLNTIRLKNSKLSNELNKKGFQITEVGYQDKIDEVKRTTVLTPNPFEEAKPDNRRYTFDMRV